MMRFEDLERVAASSLAEAAQGVEAPSVAAMAGHRRRQRISSGLAVAVVVVGFVTAINSVGGSGPMADVAAVDESTPTALVPATTVPAEGGGSLFGPPRIDSGDLVEFPMTLLDGSTLSLTLPGSVAADVAGFVPGGAAGWEMDVCCGRTLDVTYGTVDDLYGNRQPDREYEDAEGRTVGFYIGADSLDYLVFQYGSWVVRAWDDGLGRGERFTEENRERYASLMNGRETSDGFLVLEPSAPMEVTPTDVPDATLTTRSGDGLVGVIRRDCATQENYADPDTVTDSGQLVSISEESGTTEICLPHDSIVVWVRRTDLTGGDLDAIDIAEPASDLSPFPSTTTTTTSPPTTTSTPGTTEPPAPAVTSIPIDVEVPLRVLAVRSINPSLSVLDLEEQTTTVYPPGLHALPLGVDGAVSTPDRDWIVWSNGIAQLISESPEQVDVELGPDPPRSISGVAPALRSIPTPNGAQVWLVQPGSTTGAPDYPTLIDLVPIRGGPPVLEVEADGDAFPVAATDTGLVLNVHRWLDTGDGFITDPGSEFVVHVTEGGSTTRLGDGQAIAAGPSRVARLGCPPADTNCDVHGTSNSLLVSGPDGSEELRVDKPLDGAWRAVSGPMIPSDAMPFNTVAPDGTRLLVSVGQDFDVNGAPARAALVVVDMATGTSRTIAEVGGATPLATWSADGRWVAMFSGSDITLVDVENPDETILLEGVVPPDHFPLAAG